MTIRIVVVDDSRDVHVMVAAVCQIHREIVLVGDAYNGRDALDVVRAAQPDVVLVDIVMPGMGGVETTRRLIEQQPGLKVVALSSFREYEYIRDMLALGAVGYLVKDALVEDLVSAIHTANRGSTILSPSAAAQLVGHDTRPSQIDFGLTGREIAVLARMGMGLTDARIAEELEISTSTVRFHQNNILHKMNVATRSQALVNAARCGII